MALANLSIFCTRKNIKYEYNNNKFKISASTWNDEFDLPDGSYSVSDIQDYFEYIIKKDETMANNPHIKIYVSKIKNRIAFKINTGYKLELLSLSSETMQLIIHSSKKDIDQNKDDEIFPKSESVEVVLVHCNLVNSNYQQASKVLFTFVPNKQFDSLTVLNTTIAIFSFIEVWFTDQNNRPLEIEGNLNITIMIGTG